MVLNQINTSEMDFSLMKWFSDEITSINWGWDCNCEFLAFQKKQVRNFMDEIFLG